MELYAALQTYFGHSSFRPGQEPLVRALLEGRDCFGVMPTGAGKSVCYQLPALLLPGLTLVISPLISLMKDQVLNLQQNGIPAAYLNSTLTMPQQELVMRRCQSGQYKLLYVSPERLLTTRFLEFIGSVTVSMVTVDEAHCVSQWGHDFRPNYLDIATLVEALTPRPVVGAFTATATQRVREDIVELLQLQDPYRVVNSFDRENLFFSVEQPKDRDHAVLRFLDRHRGESGIIYCISRLKTESLAQLLNQRGHRAAPYHAGLEPAVRQKNQDDFLFDRVNVMAATNAFGMGIDKSNVSFVLHYGMPRDLESYYQEAGRAGRDGSPAECLLLYSPRDARTHRYLIDNSLAEAEGLTDQERDVLRRTNLERLDRMVRYCECKSCLRRNILSYFGERTATPKCDNCSSCIGPYETADLTREAQMLLSCVLRIRQKGIAPTWPLVKAVLIANPTDEVRSQALDQLSTYGLMKPLRASLPDQLLELLMHHGFLAERDEVLLVPEKARGLLFGSRSLIVRKPRPQPDHKTHTLKPSISVANEVEPGLFEVLKGIRTELAKKAGIPPYVVCSDATLYDFCRKLPQNVDELRLVNGFGQVKAERYGKAFLLAEKQYRAMHPKV